jgi:hypothetical protein
MSNDIHVQVRVNGDNRTLQSERMNNFQQERYQNGYQDEENGDNVGGPFDKNNMEAPLGIFHFLDHIHLFYENI